MALSKIQKIDALRNAMRYFGIPAKYFVSPSGNLFHIVSQGESGGYVSHTEFYTYGEMNAFLKGYNMAKTKPLI